MKRVMYYFEKIASIPHGSGNTKELSDYIVHFAKSKDLEVYQDEYNNIIVIKEASLGYESASPIIIQGHLDMVCEKENDKEIDFDNEGITIYTDGDFLKADRTTLGADDGIAVAYALALLEDDTLLHPRLEIVLTVDEEVGMTGAINLDVSVLKGKTMLNIDSDIEGHFLTSCAGGASICGTLEIQRHMTYNTKLKIIVAGLEGGHSGSEIHKEHGNANKIMGRLLKELSDKVEFYILSINGGLKDNAIPRSCECDIVFNIETIREVTSFINKFNVTIQEEYYVTEPNIDISIEIDKEDSYMVLDVLSTRNVISILYLMPHSVVNREQKNLDLIETSLNPGIIQLNDSSFEIIISVRSSVASRKKYIMEQVCHLITLLGGTYIINGEYPAWEYCKNSNLREKISELYFDLYGEEAIFESIHAGLECGIFSNKIAQLDCVSFGPDNYDIHTPKERLSISSTQRVWNFLKEFLKRWK